MVKIKKDERKLLIITYLLCILLFLNLAILKDPIDYRALIMGGIVCVLIGVSHLVIRKFYPDGDKFLLIFSCILSEVGIATIYSINEADAIKQIMWFVAGIIMYVLTVVLLPDMTKLAKLKKVYLIATVILMPLAFIYGKITGNAINGAYNWISLGFISIQPSEFAKITLVLYLGAVLKDFDLSKSGKEHIKSLIEPAIVVVYCIGLLVLQRDLGSALLFFGVSISILYVATSKKKYIFTCIGLFAMGGAIAYKLFSHVRQRISIWQNPWKDPSNEGFQVVEGLYSISSGGMLGSGLGQGYPNFVPFASTDYIFAAICEQFGMVFGIGIMVIFFLFFYRGIRVAFITTNRFSQIIAVGLSVMIACQCLVIISGIFAIIPLTGITLPFISYGGSSMISTFFLLGILQKISEEG